MSRCTDRRFENKLHHYELGMLSDDELREFEVHLLECDHCFRRAEKFKETARLLNTDADVRALIKEVDEAAELSPEPAARPRRPLRVFALPASLAAAAVLVFLVLKPWEIQIRPTSEAVAQENRLAVMYFENLADPTDSLRWGDIITNLLIADLSESHLVSVVSSQRLFDIARLLGKPDARVDDPATATEIARRAGARWMLTGSIAQMGPPAVVTAQVTEIASGEITGSFRAITDSTASIFALVDELTRRTKRALDLAITAAEEPDPPVMEVTTRSAEAYRYYLEGVDYQARLYGDKAARAFEKAVALDSTFAMAYYHLSALTDRTLIAKAVAHSGQAGRKEQYFIRSRAALISRNIGQALAVLEELVAQYPDEKEAWFMLGQVRQQMARLDEAVDDYDRATRIDPLYKQAYNALAYVNSARGDLTGALEAIDRYIELAPDEPNPYDTRGEICGRNGDLDGAIESFRRALAVDPDFAHALSYLGLMSLFKGDFVRADSCGMALAHKPDTNFSRAASLYLCMTPMMRGRPREAIAALDVVIKADSADVAAKGVPTKADYARALKALAYWELGRLDSAAAELDAARRFRLGTNAMAGEDRRHIYAQVLAQLGRIEDAATVVDTLEQEMGRGEGRPFGYWYAAGALALAEGRFDDAVVHFETAAGIRSAFEVRYWLIQAYLNAGKPEQALAELQKLMRIYESPRAFYGVWSVKLHYYLGMSWERLGDRDRAADEYRRFLEIWRDADPQLAVLDSARTALARTEIRP